MTCIISAIFVQSSASIKAKGELKKRLERSRLGGRIVGIEKIDKMTDRQIAAKVRQYFQEKSARCKD